MNSSKNQLAAVLLALTVGVARAEMNPPIKVLIVDGFSNHDRARASMLIRGILEPTKPFRVGVATCPANIDDPAFATFRPRLADFDAVIPSRSSLDNSGQRPAAMREDFVWFVGCLVEWKP